MNIDIDFDEALEEFCKDQRGHSYSRPDMNEMSERCEKLLDCLYSYEEEADAIIKILEKNETIKQYVIDKLGGII